MAQDGGGGVQARAEVQPESVKRERESDVAEEEPAAKKEREDEQVEQNDLATQNGQTEEAPGGAQVASPPVEISDSGPAGNGGSSLPTDVVPAEPPKGTEAVQVSEVADTRKQTGDNGSARHVELCDEARGLLDAKIAAGVLTASTLDDTVLMSLQSLPPADQVTALQQFFRTEMSRMKNPSAYLSGVIRSIHKSRDTTRSASNAFERSRLGRQIESLTRKGVLKDGDVDDKLLRRLQEEPPDVAEMALILFEEHVPVNCRNRSAFLTSQLKIAYQRMGGDMGDPFGPHGDPPGGYDPGRGGPPHGHPMRGMPPRGPIGGHGPGPGGGPPFPGGPGGPQPPFRGGPVGGGRGGPAGGPGPGAGPVGLGPRGRQASLARAGGGRGPRMPGSYDYTEEQLAAGVRVDELHTCSELARFLPPPPARALQDLFDAGISLVDFLDRGAWRQLAALQADEALDVIDGVGASMSDPSRSIRNINAFFTSAVKKRVPDIMDRVQEAVALMAEAPPPGPLPAAPVGPRGPVGGGMPHAADTPPRGRLPAAGGAGAGGGHVAPGPVYGYNTVPRGAGGGAAGGGPSGLGGHQGMLGGGPGAPGMQGHGALMPMQGSHPAAGPSAAALQHQAQQHQQYGMAAPGPGAARFPAQQQQQQQPQPGLPQQQQQSMYGQGVAGSMYGQQAPAVLQQQQQQQQLEQQQAQRPFGMAGVGQQGYMPYGGQPQAATSTAALGPQQQQQQQQRGGMYAAGRGAPYGSAAAGGPSAQYPNATGGGGGMAGASTAGYGMQGPGASAYGGGAPSTGGYGGAAAGGQPGLAGAYDPTGGVGRGGPAGYGYNPMAAAGGNVGAGGGATGAAPAPQQRQQQQPPMLSTTVQQRISSVVMASGGTVRFDHFSQNVCTALATMGPTKAMAMLAALDATDKRQIPDMSTHIHNLLRSFA